MAAARYRAAKLVSHLDLHDLRGVASQGRARRQRRASGAAGAALIKRTARFGKVRAT
jgi:hypothetical protein